jgi:hypothetical protein
MLQCGISRRMENTMESRTYMTTTQFATAREGAAIRRRDSEPVEDLVQADAEEEEIAELWAGDPGNQGA